MVKIQINSKEAMHRLNTGNEMIELEVTRDKDGKVVESKGVAEVSDEEFERLTGLGKKFGFTVSKTK